MMREVAVQPIDQTTRNPHVANDNFLDVGAEHFDHHIPTLVGGAMHLSERTRRQRNGVEIFDHNVGVHSPALLDDTPNFGPRDSRHAVDQRA